MIKHNTLEMNIGGKVRPMAFDFNCLDYVTEGSDLATVIDMQTTKPWKFVPQLTLAALRAGAERENKKDKFSLEEVSEWIMGMEDAAEVAKIATHFKASLGFIYQGATGTNPFPSAVPAESPAPSPSPES